MQSSTIGILQTWDIGLFCLFTCIIGMILWYNKYQKYLDMKLKEETLNKDEKTEENDIVKMETKDPIS